MKVPDENQVDKQTNYIADATPSSLSFGEGRGEAPNKSLLPLPVPIVPAWGSCAQSRNSYPAG